MALLCLLGAEAACEVAYRLHTGKWYFQVRRQLAQTMVKPHPYFGQSLVPGRAEERNGVYISHNSFGCRGAEFARPKPAGRIRIVALGGSTTYCTGVSDTETWEYFLGNQLGTNYEVINLGLPGGTSVEALIQTALLFSELQPDIALYYLGWNDAQVQHVKGLRPDWSDSHGKLMLAMGLENRGSPKATVAGYYLQRMQFRSMFGDLDSGLVLGRLEGAAGALTGQIDQQALGYYERNLRLIAALCRAQGVRVCFVPQVLNYGALTDPKPYGWLPFVRDCDLQQVMRAYNESLGKIANQEGALYGDAVLKESFTASDFVDNGHFSRSGNQRFAAQLVSCISNLARAHAPPSH